MPALGLGSNNVDLLWERIVEIALVAQICQVDPITWGQLIPALADTPIGSKTVELDRKAPIQQLGKCTNPANILSFLNDKNSGYAYRWAPQSSSHEFKQSWGYVDIQDKSGKQQIGVKELRDEIQKAVPEGKVYLIVFAWALNPLLTAAMGKRAALVLPPGSYTTGRYNTELTADG